MHAVGVDEEQRIIDVLSPDIKPNQAAGCDKRAFLMAISRLKAMTQLQVTAELMGAGPLQVSELDGLKDVFIRGMAEVEEFLRQKR